MTVGKKSLAGLVGLPPVTDAHTRVLILGSFPGEASLRVAQYYAHPQNHFWPLMGHILGLPLKELTYETRLRILLEHGIGVWDVIESCRRRGSLDSDIRQAQSNDFARLQRECPRLHSVFFNGKKSASYAAKLVALGLETHVLPSSSPAYTVPFNAKAREWQRIGIALRAKLPMTAIVRSDMEDVMKNERDLLKTNVPEDPIERASRGSEILKHPGTTPEENQPGERERAIERQEDMQKRDEDLHARRGK